MTESTKGEADYRDSSDRIIIVGGENRDYICTVQIKQTTGGAIGESMEDTRKANAERLVLCWNSHDKLLAALEEIRKVILKLSDDAGSERFTIHQSNTNNKYDLGYSEGKFRGIEKAESQIGKIIKEAKAQPSK